MPAGARASKENVRRGSFI
jgi:hypothetical protein